MHQVSEQTAKVQDMEKKLSEMSEKQKELEGKLSAGEAASALTPAPEGSEDTVALKKELQGTCVNMCVCLYGCMNVRISKIPGVFF